MESSTLIIGLSVRHPRLWRRYAEGPTVALLNRSQGHELSLERTDMAPLVDFGASALLRLLCGTAAPV